MPEDYHPPVHPALLLFSGVFLLLVPVMIAIAWPGVLLSAQIYLRAISALGGGLIGVFIPGAFGLELAWLKASAAAGIFALIYTTNPAIIAADVTNPPKPAAPHADAAAQKLSNWLFPTTTPDGKPKLDKERYAELKKWAGSDYSNVPLNVLLNDPAAEKARQVAARQLTPEPPARSGAPNVVTVPPVVDNPTRHPIGPPIAAPPPR